MSSEFISSLFASGQSAMQRGREMLNNNKEKVMAHLSFDRSSQKFNENPVDHLYGRSRYAFLTKLAAVVSLVTFALFLQSAIHHGGAGTITMSTIVGLMSIDMMKEAILQHFAMQKEKEAYEVSLGELVGNVEENMRHTHYGFNEFSNEMSEAVTQVISDVRNFKDQLFNSSEEEGL